MKYKGVVDVNKKGNKKGFTLVEIIVVLVILAILAAIAVPSVLGYVEQAKESEQIYKVRDALIASQTTLIRTYGTDGEFGDDNGSKNGNKKLTKEQAADLKSKAGLEKNPYILIFGAGHTSYKGSADEEKMYHVYCVIYQETKDSKPWFYDGKIWSHKYLWSKSGEANAKEEVGRAMYTKAENGINYNRMKGVKDSTKQDVKVQLYCAYIKGESNASDNVPGFWNDIRNKSN